jgi:hypothetical protein
LPYLGNLIMQIVFSTVIRHICAAVVYRLVARAIAWKADDKEKQSYSMACAKRWCSIVIALQFFSKVSWVLFCNNLNLSFKKCFAQACVGKLFFIICFVLSNITVELASSWDVRWRPRSSSSSPTFDWDDRRNLRSSADSLLSVR